MYNKNQYPFYSKANKQNNYNNYRYSMKDQVKDDIERKLETRKKIMLGGLIIKVGLDYLHPKDAAVLYGMLLSNKKLLSIKPELLERWREIGKDLKTV